MSTNAARHWPKLAPATSSLAYLSYHMYKNRTLPLNNMGRLFYEMPISEWKYRGLRTHQNDSYRNIIVISLFSRDNEVVTALHVRGNDVVIALPVRGNDVVIALPARGNENMIALPVRGGRWSRSPRRWHCVTTVCWWETGRDGRWRLGGRLSR